MSAAAEVAKQGYESTITERNQRLAALGTDLEQLQFELQGLRATLETTRADAAKAASEAADVQLRLYSELEASAQSAKAADAAAAEREAGLEASLEATKCEAAASEAAAAEREASLEASLEAAKGEAAASEAAAARREASLEASLEAAKGEASDLKNDLGLTITALETNTAELSVTTAARIEAEAKVSTVQTVSS